MLIADLWTSFILGLATPLTAVCVLPLYPGFVAYLANRLTAKPTKKTMALLGVMIALGVVLFMMLLGLVFTTLLEQSLTNVIGILSPIAFGLLLIISILLLFNVDFSRFLPHWQGPQSKSPLLSAFLYGLFFGAIVIPCNPLFIAAFFTKAFFTGVTDVLSAMLNVIAFGIGIGFPLIVLSIASASFSRQLISFLTKHKRALNMISGLIMLVISLYYLLFVFRIFG